MAGLLTAIVASCGERPPEPGPPTPRNLVVIVLDTLRPDHLGCYGYERDTSANLDALAAGGVVFESAQSASPWTAPSLVSIMTALHPDVHQVRDFPRPARMPEDVTTLAEELRDHGLQTAAFTEGGFAKGDFGLDQGFDLYWKNQGDEHSDHSHTRFGSRLEKNAGLAIEWLEKNHERPFFLFFHTYEPHTPYHPEPEHLAAILPTYDAEAERAALREAVALWRAGGEPSPEQWLLIARHGHHCELEEARVELQGEGDRPAVHRELWQDLVERGYGRGGRGGVSGERLPALLPFLRALYDAEIRYADEQVARILGRLEELGHGEDTLVVVLSDHGEAFNEHGILGHGLDLHEEVLRIVCILRGPGLEGAPARVPELVRAVDLMPTVLELFGRGADRLPLQGRSLLALLRGESGPLPAFSHSTAFREEIQRSYSVRTARWRYIAAAKGPERSLYDLQADPGETEDVLEQHPEVAERLEQLLTDQRREDERLRARYSGERSWPELDEETLRELRGLGYLDEE